MIDDAFLRQVAALQANLKMLESQQDALSDLADMKELRLYKSRLCDYIEAHARAGQLPRDPFRVVEQRLSALSGFFAAADREHQHLKGWKADWLNYVPAVGLADLQSARTELAERVAEVAHIQERLAQRLSPLDWDTSTATVDLHADLMGCAMCVSGLKIPQKPARRVELYQFARGEGDLTKKTSSHFKALGLRIEKLITLHAEHVKAVAETDQHLSNHDFRSAQNAFGSLARNRFLDIDSQKLDSRKKKLEGVFARFTNLDVSLDQRLKENDCKAVRKKLDSLSRLIEKPDSELGREGLALLQRMESRFATAQKASKKRWWTNFAIVLPSIVGLAALSLYVIKENAKAEEARVIALAKAKIEAAEAKAKAEVSWAKSCGKRAGEEKVIELASGVTMTFCWCPAGKFVMGSPTSEFPRSDDEDQVEVTLSQGFWMAKTEVTQAQWQAVMGTNPSGFKGDDLPVENVSWSDVQEFIAKVNARGVIPGVWKMVLPTEAQWEYACRAGETGPYSGGSIEQLAWYDEKSEKQSHPVGTKKPNAWGLHDMHGNVWEWCADWHDDRLSGGTDPNGASSGVYRVLRGGSWNHDAAHCRAAFRSWHFPNSRSNELGFRPALVPSK